MNLEPLSQKEKEDWIERIKQMSQIEMARLWRFAPSGHPIFSTLNDPLFQIFEERFQELGGMTPKISKAIGW